MFLLENQLPFFILKDIFSLVEIAKSIGEDDGKLAVVKLTQKFTKNCWGFLGVDESLCGTEHFGRVKHLVDFLRICMLCPNFPKYYRRPKVLTIPSATRLNQAGVVFKLGKNSNLFDITFKDGILEIPKIEVRGSTEIVLKNLMAFEQSQLKENEISDYVILMFYLVNTSQDVELLAHNAIIENRIGDSKVVANLFRNLSGCSSFGAKSFIFAELFEDLNAFSQTPWRMWMGTLRRDCFNSAWGNTVSVIVACALFILTFVQTICSIVPLFQK
ncbi:hypothetical protein OWV82_003215 [Melia azedarach]|uniref:Uncharacterized protein n=1 Tax=Melia azedarach TaxID=155640 RepID=A0ACC1YKJ9_MELAZ|nr:hypothetical protein OWV82_003215 [Melia azedarach]